MIHSVNSLQLSESRVYATQYTDNRNRRENLQVQDPDASSLSVWAALVRKFVIWRCNVYRANQHYQADLRPDSWKPPAQKRFSLPVLLRV
jgi:O-glycosyl hydrolase